MITPPNDTPEYAHGAWASALSFALHTPEIRAAFESDTGKHYSPPKCAIDSMIDEATGFQSDYLHAFGGWFNVNVWGPWEGPAL